MKPNEESFHSTNEHASLEIKLTPPLLGNPSEQSKQLYERYKLQWMLYHGFSLTDLMECMEFMICEDIETSGSCFNLQELFETWEFGVGFDGGQIWACYEDYLENEHQLSEKQKTFDAFSM